jgi:hypothetical protein
VTQRDIRRIFCALWALFSSGLLAGYGLRAMGY